MISSNQYQDIEIQQHSDFTNTITFDVAHTMLTTFKYAAVIAKDYDHTAFSGPNKATGTDGTYANDDVWNQASVNVVQFDLIADISAKTVTLTLPAEATRFFTDDFEGVWDLVEMDDITNDVYIRQIQGDVVISKGVTRIITDTFKVAQS